MLYNFPENILLRFKVYEIAYTFHVYEYKKKDKYNLALESQLGIS